MTYGLGTRLFIENGPAATAAEALETRSAARPWRALPAETRLVLIENALRPPANDLIDAFPLAL